MRTGSACRRARARGFTYIGLLFAVALAAAALAVAGQRWSTALQRERERELIFRGNEIARALASYGALSTEGQAQGPARLEELVADERGPKTVHHLRRLYADPFTGQPDWILLTNADKRIQGVRSRSQTRAFMTVGLSPRPGGSPARVGDRAFYASAAPAVRAPANAASGVPAGGTSPIGSRLDKGGDESSPLVRSLPP